MIVLSLLQVNSALLLHPLLHSPILITVSGTRHKADVLLHNHILMIQQFPGHSKGMIDTDFRYPCDGGVA